MRHDSSTNRQDPRLIVLGKEGAVRQFSPALKDLCLQPINELARISGFSSRDHYLGWWARNKGYDSSEEFEQELFRTAKEHLESNRKIQAWSNRDWETILHRTRPCHSPKEPAHQKQPPKRPIALLISQRLEELGRTQRWLARELGISRQAVHQYVLGATIPRKTLRSRLKEVLEINDDQLLRSITERRTDND